MTHASPTHGPTLVLLVRHGKTPTTGRQLPGRTLEIQSRLLACQAGGVTGFACLRLRTYPPALEVIENLQPQLAPTVGEVEAVFADLRRLNPAIAGEDCGTVLFRMRSGARALFDGNRLAVNRERERLAARRGGQPSDRANVADPRQKSTRICA